MGFKAQRQTFFDTHQPKAAQSELILGLSQ